MATKYLNNYLIWHIWFDMKGHTQLEMSDLFLVKAIAYAISVFSDNYPSVYDSYKYLE